MNTSILSLSWKGWIVCLGLASMLLAAPLARAASLLSPDVHHTWAYAQLDRKQYYWDDKSGFAVALTYTTEPYASRNNPPESETLLFHFPTVRHIAGAGRFVIDSKHGQTVVAHKGFLGSIKLSDGNRLLVQRRSSLVWVTLEVGDKL
jgi:hypothetical protein